MKNVLQPLKDYKKQLAVGPTFKFIEAILELIVPLLIAKMVDLGVESGDKSIIFRYGGLSLLLAVTGMGCAYICQYNAAIASQGYGTRLRNDLYRKILLLREQDVAKIGVSSLTTRMTSDIQVLQQAVAMLIRLVVRAPFLSIGSLIMVFSINAKLALIFVAVLLLFVLFLWLIMRRLLPMYSQVQQKTDKSVSRILELLNGVRVIRALARDEEKAEQFETTNEELERMIDRVGRTAAIMNPATWLLLNFAAVGVLWLGAYEFRFHGLGAGELIAMINYLGMMLTALSVVANLVILYTRAYACAIRVQKVFDLPSRRVEAEEDPVGKAFSPDPDAPIIAFDNVTFTYPGNREPLFENMSFTLPRGKTLGIIGPTGSGKSTLAALLTGRYPLDAGSIRLYGKDIRDMSERELLSTVFHVLQKSRLFKGTVRSNLKLAKPDADETEMYAAIDDAQASEFIQDLDREVERDGANFSGGQKQRLCIARALLTPAKILIFDDSSSALDYATDARLYQALTTRERYRDRVLVTISQRVETVRRSDLLLLMDNGAIAGFGTHDELLADVPLYQEIYRSQAQAEFGEEVDDV